MSAIFLPTMPYSRTSAVTCTTAMYTQPKPMLHAWPGPPTNELTDPYVAMVVMASTKPPKPRLRMKYSFTKPPAEATSDTPSAEDKVYLT